MTTSIKITNNKTAEELINEIEIKNDFAIVLDNSTTIIGLNEYAVLVGVSNKRRHIIGSTRTFERIIENIKNHTILKREGDHWGTPVKDYYLDINTDLFIREETDEYDKVVLRLYFNEID